MKAYLIKTNRESRKLSNTLFPLIFEQETGKAISYENLPRNEHGKPQPIDDIYFNISHSGNYWCIVFSNSECGIDIEMNRELNARIARRILCDDEMLINGDLLRNWVIKEAYVKMLGTGIGAGLASQSAAQIIENNQATDLSSEEFICYAIGKDSVTEVVSLGWDGNKFHQIGTD